tara:strand:- start:319 stop:834 length:516 start_codon:yes stop_codon:yes gene_type:complete
MEKPDLQYLGKFIKLFSFKGEILLYSELNKDYLLDNIDSIFISLNESFIPFKISRIKTHKKNIFRFQIDGINNDSEAEKLLKKEVFILKTIGANLDDQAISQDIVENFQVFNDNEYVGIVISVIENKDQSIIEVETNVKRVLIPLVKDFIDKIDLEKKELKMILPDGLLEL